VIIALATETVRTSETSVYSETTRHYIAEGSRLYTIIPVGLLKVKKEKKTRY
jgi:hypothetical protein